MGEAVGVTEDVNRNRLPLLLEDPVDGDGGVLLARLDVPGPSERGGERVP
jgi:hypothetical protein